MLKPGLSEQRFAFERDCIGSGLSRRGGRPIFSAIFFYRTSPVGLVDHETYPMVANL